MDNRVQIGNICAVIEREVIVGEGLCKDCLANGLRTRWAMVKRYRVPGDSKIARLLGIGDGSIEPKGMPDNASGQLAGGSG